MRPWAHDAATARIGYSSIIDGARSGGMLGAVQGARADPQIGDGLAALDPLVEIGDVGAHLLEARQQPGARRVEADAPDDHFRPRHHQRGDDRERGGGNVGRDDDRRGDQLGLADDGDTLAAALRPAGRAPIVAEMAEASSFEVWSRVAWQARSPLPSRPGVLSPASSTADFTCADAHRQRV